MLSQCSDGSQFKKKKSLKRELSNYYYLYEYFEYQHKKFKKEKAIVYVVENFSKHNTIKNNNLD